MIEANAPDDIKGFALQRAVYVNRLIRSMLPQASRQALGNL